MFHDYAVGSIFENLFYLTYKWTCVCPLSQITPLRWLLTYTSHKHATLSIYMLHKTCLDMYMSIKPNHTIDMTVNIHIQLTCCQSTLQYLYSITHTTLRHRVVQHLTRHCRLAYGRQWFRAAACLLTCGYCAVPRPAPCSRLLWSPGATTVPQDSAQDVDVTRGILRMYIWPKTDVWNPAHVYLAKNRLEEFSSKPIEPYRGSAVHRFLIRVPVIHPRVFCNTPTCSRRG